METVTDTKPPSAEDSALAANLRRLRSERGWSQSEAAAQTGVSAQLLGMIESGKRPNPTLETLRLLADTYGVTLDELTQDEDATPPELARLLESGVLGDVELETLRRLKRARALFGREPTAHDYLVILGLIRK